MNKKLLSFLGFALPVISLSLQAFAFTGSKSNSTSNPNPFKSNKVNTSLNNLPLSFIENKGQVTDQDGKRRDDIQFQLKAASGLNIFIGNGAIHYQFSKCDNQEQVNAGLKIPGSKFQDPKFMLDDMKSVSYTLDRMDVELQGANKNAQVVTEQLQEYYENYITSSVRQAHVDNITKSHVYTRITYKDIYPNIDWVLYIKNGRLEHEFLVHPGGNVGDIKLKYGGASSLEINKDGSLLANTPQGNITEGAPYAFQKGGTQVACDFKINNGILSYKTAEYNGELVIDPVLGWATYYGGSGGLNSGYSLSTDDSGNVYVTGRTISSTGIATSGAYQTTFAGTQDAFLAKFDSTGAIQWATYYGGSGGSEPVTLGYGVATDGSGNVYVTGYSQSTTGIATSGAYQSTLAGGAGDAFVAKFSNGGALLWSTYYGGGYSGTEITYGCSAATDGSGNVFITGYTTSSVGIAYGSSVYQTTMAGNEDAFLAKFSSAGVMQWATYYGGGGSSGSATNFGQCLATDGSGNVYITGYTNSSTGIATSGAYQTTLGGSQDAYLAKFSNSGSIQWATYFGANATTSGEGVATDGSGNVYLTGATSSTSGIATSGTYQTTLVGSNDAYVAEFNSAGTIQWGTYYGGSGGVSGGDALVIDSSGNVYITGSTQSTSGIATTGAYQTTLAGSYDAFLAQFNNTGGLEYGTYYGGGTGSIVTYGLGVATGSSRNVYLTGLTQSSTGIATSGAYQTTLAGTEDAFLANFSGFNCTAPTIFSVSPMAGYPASSVTISGSGFNTTAIDNAVFFGATKATVSSASSASLTVNVPSEGTFFPVTVNNLGCNRTAYSYLQNSFLPTYDNTGYINTVANFDPKVDFATGVHNGYVVALGDIDGDGKADIVFTDEGFSVYRNTATSGAINSGSFASRADFTASNPMPFGIALGDLNGDGKLDVVVANPGINTITVFINTSTPGSVSFAAGVDFATGTWPEYVAIGDIDGDGKPDIVGTNQVDGTISIWHNNSTPSTLNLSSRVVLSTPTYPAGVAIGDLDGDGKPEIIVCTTTGGYVSVFHNTSTAGTITTGSFGTRQDFAGYSQPFVVTLGDIDGDGKTDIVLSDIGGKLSIFQNTSSLGSVSLASRLDITGGSSPAGVALGDINGDGKVDIAMSEYGSNEVSVFLNNSTSGSISLNPIVNFATDVTPYGLAIGDLDGDGKPDMVVPNAGTDEMSVYRNDPLQQITGATSVCAGGSFSLSDATLDGTWSSSNTGVATVGSLTGIVTGVAGGTAIISYIVTNLSGISYTSQVITVNSAPSVTITPSTSATVCLGLGTAFTASVADTLLNQNFNGAISGWTITNSMTLPATDAANEWQSKPDGYSNIDEGVTYHSNDNSQFFMANSDTGGGGVTLTILTSPVFSLAGLASASLDFYQYYFYFSTFDTAQVQISTDGGTTWSGILANYTASVGAPTSFSNTTLSLTPYVGNANCMLRFYYHSAYGWSWAIDNVSITGEPTFTWAGVSGATGLSCTSCATTTITPTATGANIYSVTTTSGGCTSSASVTVNVNPLPAVITGATSVCTGFTTTLNDVSGPGTWSSSNLPVATIGSSTGIVSGVSLGSAVITYSLSTGCYVTTTVNVNSNPSAITGSNNICAGSTTNLTDGGGGTWVSSNTAKATIGSSSGTVTGVSAGSSTITYTLGTGCYTTLAVTVNTVPGAITGTKTVCTGATTTLNDFGLGNWTSNTTGVATVGSGSGIVSGVTAGTSTITFMLATTCYATTVVTVNQTPAAIGGAAPVCTSSSLTLSETTGGGSWISSTVAVATIGSSSGTVNGLTVGSTTISYVMPTGCQITQSINVTQTPAAITGNAPVCTGFTITLHDATGAGNYTSSAIGTASVVGGTGVVTGVAAGTATITYTLATCYATTVATVNLTPVAISGAAPVCTGANLTLTDATGGGGTWVSSTVAVATIGSSSGTVNGLTVGSTTISYIMPTGCQTTQSINVTQTPAVITGSTPICVGATVNLHDVTGAGNYTSSTPAVATVVGGTGVVTGVTAGTTIITYTLATCYAVTTVTVLPTPLAITPAGPISLCIANSTTLNDVTPLGTWTSSNSALATVGSSSGTVTGVATGAVVIDYTIANGCFASENVNIISGTAPILPASPTVCTGSTTNLTDASGTSTWTITLSTGSATIGAATGIVNGVTAGSGTVTFTVGTCYSTATITILQSPAAITPAGPLNLCEGNTITLNDISVGTWSSGAVGTATVGSSTGTVTGILTGAVTISYTNAAGCSATDVVNVNTTPVAILPSSPSVCPTGTISLSDGTGGGAWGSANGAIATINAVSGLATGVAAGTVVMSYTLGTCFTTTTLTVNASPNSGSITGASNVCVSASTPLVDLAGGGTWSSSNAGVATIGSSTGIVTGVTTGSAIITYTVTNVCGTATSTAVINVLPLASVSSISGPVLLCAGTFTTLTDTTSGGTWSSANSNASVTGGGLVLGITTGTDIISYTITNSCGSVSATFPITIGSYLSAGTISGLSNVCVGSSITLSDPVPGGLWISGNTDATVSAGLVTGVTAGTVIISYSVSSGCGTAIATQLITVNPLPDAGIISGVSLLCTGSSVLFTDAAAGGVWSSTNFTANVTSGGIVTGITPGTDTINYTVTNVCGTAVASNIVTMGPPPYDGTITGPSNVCPGATITLADAAGGGVWSSSNANATVSVGVVTGVSAGTSIISYSVTGSCGTVSAIYSVTINPGPTAGIISGPATVCDGSTITLSDFVSGGSWSSSNPSVATIVMTSGLVTGVGAGIDTIYYSATNSCGTAVATATITSIALPVAGTITGPSTVCVGSSISLSDVSGGGTWSSTNTAIGTIDPLSGILTGIATGSDIINYTVSNSCGSASALASISVNPMPNAGAITGTSVVCAGSAISLTDLAGGGSWIAGNSNATVSGTGLVTGVTAGTDPISYEVSNSCGTADAIVTITINPLPDAGTITGPTDVCIGASTTFTDGSSGGVWSSSNTAIATVGSGSGLVSGVSTGSVVINYIVTNSCGTASASAALSIDPAPVAGTIIGSSNVCVGSSITLTDATPGGIWSAGNADATVSGGVVNGVTAGTDPISYTVSAACGSVSAIVSITINPLPDAGAIAGPSTVCIGSSISLTDAAGGGVWTAANANATVSGGLVTGVTSGMDTVNYSVTNSCGTATASQVITIGGATSAGVITGPSSVCTGSTITLTDGVSGGIWGASNGNATISGGMVTGITPGIDTISYSVTGSCGSASVTQIINIANLPIAGTLSGPSSVCTGGSVTITASISGGAWSRTNSRANVAGGIVTGVSAGLDTIIYTITNGCGSGIASKDIAVISGPGAGSISGPASVCVGATVSLSDFAGGGVWTSSNASIASSMGGGLVSGIAPGTVNIDYTVTNGCGSAVAEHVLTVNDCGGGGGGTGVANTPVNDINIKVLPNPSKGEFLISGSYGVTSDDEVTIQVTDMLGQVVYNGKTITKAGNINTRIILNNAANGMYLLTLRNGDGINVFRIVVEQ